MSVRTYKYCRMKIPTLTRKYLIMMIKNFHLQDDIP